LIGSGIGPSLSPALHEQEAAALGVRCVYRILDIDESGRGVEATGRLLCAAREVGFDGLNITHPCKRIVIDHLDGLSAEAAQVGAVNTIVFADGRAIGHNTDGVGFARALRRGLPDAALEHVVLLGAGGAGAAVAHALFSSGAQQLTIVDLDGERACALAAAATTWSAGTASAEHPGRLDAVLARADGLVHATPTGMAGHPGLPVPEGSLHPGLWVADIVYRPLETELMTTARRAGCRVLGGGGMVVFQAAEAFRLFTGVEPDPERMTAHFDQLVKAEAVASAAQG
jgi:shikimate dehydrogenase